MRFTEQNKADFQHVAYKWALQATLGQQLPACSEQSEASLAEWILGILWNLKEPASSLARQRN